MPVSGTFNPVDSSGDRFQLFRRYFISGFFSQGKKLFRGLGSFNLFLLIVSELTEDAPVNVHHRYAPFSCLCSICLL